jgi:hypothetical protein
MALTLTYDPSDDPQALAEAEARDQESLEIGERLQQEQESLLAGKYRDAEELEQAYLELQKKLGSRNNDEPAEVEQEPEPEQEEEIDEAPDYSFLNRLAEEADGGEFTQETLQALEQMSASDIADMFLAYRQEQGTQESYVMNQEDIDEMKSVVGGQDQYNQMIAWASQALSPEEIQVYDSVMDKGDPQAIYFAIQALNYRYQDAVGTDGRLLTGNAPISTADVFRSQAEVVRAMNDPRYDSDPAYRQDVFDKLERSNLQF